MAVGNVIQGLTVSNTFYTVEAATPLLKRMHSAPVLSSGSSLQCKTPAMVSEVSKPFETGGEAPTLEGEELMHESEACGSEDFVGNLGSRVASSGVQILAALAGEWPDCAPSTPAGDTCGPPMAASSSPEQAADTAQRDEAHWYEVLHKQFAMLEHIVVTSVRDPSAELEEARLSLN